MSPDDHMHYGYSESRKNVEYEMLEKMKEISPNSFERLVVRLVEKMGYGDGENVGRSRDGGIDGVIRGDKLGLNHIYLQAKMWNSTVPISQVRDFAGALSVKKTSNGVFITTSDFSQDAYEFVNTPSNNIILINGRKLIRLMFENNVGFKTKDTYRVKEIDEEFLTDLQ